MVVRISNPISWLVLLLVAAGLSGCMTVKSTTAYYVPTTTKIYPPKSKDAPIPILSKAPPENYAPIGHLAFTTTKDWNFLRKSMIYNAQVNGADAVIVRKLTVNQQMNYQQVPPRYDWVPQSVYYRNRHGQVSGYTTWVPIFQPGYIQQWIDVITNIDAEMIVVKK